MTQDATRVLLVAVEGSGDLDAACEDLSALTEHADLRVVDDDLAVINSEICRASSKHVAVLPAGSLILDEGWLGHVTTFLERRRDAGLVGIGGFHTIDRDGRCLDPVEGDRRGWRDAQPVGRFTEVVAAGPAGWIMRSGDNLFDEAFERMCLASCADLSLQYHKQGLKVFSVDLDLRPVVVEDRPEEAERFARKWSTLLPLEHKYGEETRLTDSVERLKREIAGMETRHSDAESVCRDAMEHSMEAAARQEAIAARARSLESVWASNGARLARLSSLAAEIEDGMRDGGDREL